MVGLACNSNEACAYLDNCLAEQVCIQIERRMKECDR